MQSPDIVIYHKNCHDGMASAWCFHNHGANKERKIEYFPCGNNEQEFPSDLEGKKVCLVDFVYTYENMLVLLNKCSKVDVFDHHKTNLPVLERLKIEYPEKLTFYFDIERSGCQLTWDVLFHPVHRPLFLDYIGDRDTWKFELPDSKLITNALYVYPATFESFDMLSRMTYFTTTMIEQGEVLQRQLDFILPFYEKAAVDRVLKISENTYRVKLVECPSFHRSDVGAHLCKSVDFAALWSFDVDKKIYSISFRSEKNRDVDVGEIAKHFGGGGHKSASAIKWDGDLDDLFKRLD